MTSREFIGLFILIVAIMVIMALLMVYGEQSRVNISTLMLVGAM